MSGPRRPDTATRILDPELAGRLRVRSRSEDPAATRVMHRALHDPRDAALTRTLLQVTPLHTDAADRAATPPVPDRAARPRRGLRSWYAAFIGVACSGGLAWIGMTRDAAPGVGAGAVPRPTPAAVVQAPPEATPAATARPARAADAQRMAGELEASTLEAVQHLIAGRYEQALVQYRALAGRGADGEVHAAIARILAQRVRADCLRGRGTCAAHP